MITTELDANLDERTFFFCENLKIDTADFQNLIELERLHEKQRADVLAKYPKLENLL